MLYLEEVDIVGDVGEAQEAGDNQGHRGSTLEKDTGCQRRFLNS